MNERRSISKKKEASLTPQEAVDWVKCLDSRIRINLYFSRRRLSADIFCNSVGVSLIDRYTPSDKGEDDINKLFHSKIPYKVKVPEEILPLLIEN